MSEVKTNVIEKGEWERELEVEVSAERMQREITSAFRSYQKRLEIPGFRKGKVPLRVIEQRYGDSIRHNVINDLLPTLMQEAAQGAGIVPAATPKITKIDHESGEALTFTAAMDIWPQIEVDNYENLPLTRMVHEVADEEIDQQLEELRARQATERSVERPLERGDVLIADLQRLDEGGLPIIGEKFDERYFIIGSEDAPSPEFDEQLIGIEPGGERRAEFTYRQDLANEELAGQHRSFSVTAKEIRERAVPELDDEFARDVGEQFESLDDLREHLREQIGERWKYLSQQKERADLIDELIKGNSFDLPGSLIESYIENMREEMEARRGHGDHDHDHAEHDHSDHDHDHDDKPEVSEEERTAAVRRLKTYLLMEGLRKKLDLQVSKEEEDGFFQKRADQMGAKADELKRSARAEDLRRELVDDKIFEYLCERADIEEKSV